MSESTTPFDLTELFVETEEARLNDMINNFPLSSRVFEPAIARLREDPLAYFDEEAKRQSDFINRPPVTPGTT